MPILASETMQLLVSPAKHNAIRGHSRRREIRKVSVAERPKIGPLLEIDAKKGVLVMPKVGAVLVKGHGCGNRSASLDFLNLLAVGERDDVEQFVASAEDGAAIRGRRRAVDVITALINPVALARDGIDTVELEIVAADQDPGRIPFGRFHPIGGAEDFVARGVLPA